MEIRKVQKGLKKVLSIETIDQNLYGRLEGVQEMLESVKNQKYDWVKKFGTIYLKVAIDTLKKELKKLK